MQQIFGLHYDFQSRNGTTLEFYAEDGLPASGLSQLQTKMLSTGRIPRTLPVFPEYKDDFVRLVYHIGARRMLAQWLRTERVTRTRLLQLLLSAAATLEECRSYMLRESGFIMRSEFLFVGPDGTDVAFVYLPLKQVNAPPQGEELSRLILELAAKLPELEQEPLFALADYCRKSSFRPEELKRKIIAELTKSGMRERFLAPLSTDEPQFEPIPPSATTSERVSEWRAKSDPFVPLSGSERTNSIAKKLSVLAAASGCACSAWLWSLFAKAPSQPMMQIAVGSTLLAAAVVCMLRLLLDDEQIFSFIRRFHLRVGTPAPRIAYEQSYDAWELDGEEPLRWGNKAADGATGAADKRQADEPLPPKPKSSPRGGLQPPTLLPHTADDYYAGLREHTTLLSANSDATVLLKPGDGCRERVAVQAYIQTDASPYAGRRISLDKPNFIIGRSGELSDLRFNREGVSRQHAEICSEQKGYSVRDLGSTNGTLLNGEEMAPYQAYPLSDGDLLTVAGTDFRFHTV